MDRLGKKKIRGIAGSLKNRGEITGISAKLPQLGFFGKKKKGKA